MTGHIVCLGDVMLDVLARMPGPLAVGSDTPATITFGHGGSAANTAAWLASLAVPVRFMGKVGDDIFGREALNFLTARGVSVSAVIDPVTATGTCIVLIGSDGERTMVPSAGANDTLSPRELPPELVTDADHLHLSAYSLLRSGSRDAALAALGRAVANRASVSVDASSADPIRRVGVERFLAWLPSDSMLMANLDEAQVLTGEADPRGAAAILATRFSSAVVKCGAQGAVVATPERVYHVGTSAVAVADSTGAGDAFAAGMLAAQRNGAELLDAVAAGNALGGRAVRQLGARPIPRE
jgi:sugar/nucleoside kinase (ribokinase family)